MKVLVAVERGIPRREVADLFGISLATICRYIKLKELKATRKDLAPKPSAGRRAKIVESLTHRRAL